MKPLCCLPLRGGLRGISLIDIIVSGLFSAASIAAIVYYEQHHKEAVHFIKNPPEWMDYLVNFRDVQTSNFRVFLGFCAFYYLQKFMLSIILLIATIKESKFLIRLFVLYSLFLIVIHALVFFTMLCFSMMELPSIVVYVMGFVFQEWTIWASSKYLDQIMFGPANDDDDFYDFGSSRRSSGEEDKFSYKL